MDRLCFLLILVLAVVLGLLAPTDAICGKRFRHQKFPNFWPNSKSNPEIVGGKEAVRGAYPWQVSIQMQQAGNKTFHFCGGSVIGHHWVLTAAHCINVYMEILPELFHVTAGEHRFAHVEGSEQVVEIDSIFKHESFDANTINNDIALIKTKQKIHFNEYVQPVCVPGAHFPYSVGSAGFISGWGNTKQVIPDLGFSNLQQNRNHPRVLQAARVPLVNQTDCNAGNRYQGLVTDQMFCAGFMAGGVDSCQGDSGGPLVILRHNKKTNDERFVLAGITSWGVGCAAPDFPGVYTKVANFDGWIHNTISANKNHKFDGVEFIQ